MIKLSQNPQNISRPTVSLHFFNFFLQEIAMDLLVAVFALKESSVLRCKAEKQHFQKITILCFVYFFFQSFCTNSQILKSWASNEPYLTKFGQKLRILALW